MIKRFYKGLLGLRYSWILTLAAVITLVLAFLHTNRQEEIYRTLLMIWIIPLAAFLIFYYYQKLSLNKALNQIKNIQEYEKGGMVKNTCVLEDRMLVGNGTTVKEYPTDQILELRGVDKGVEVKREEETFLIETLDAEEARRLVAFLKRKNPKATIVDIEPKGDGSLTSLGAN